MRAKWEKKDLIWEDVKTGVGWEVDDVNPFMPSVLYVGHSVKHVRYASHKHFLKGSQLSAPYPTHFPNAPRPQSPHPHSNTLRPPKSNPHPNPDPGLPLALALVLALALALVLPLALAPALAPSTWN